MNGCFQPQVFDDFIHNQTSYFPCLCREKPAILFDRDDRDDE